jgi:hypothetical protein
LLFAAIAALLTGGTVVAIRRRPRAA